MKAGLKSLLLSISMALLLVAPPGQLLQSIALLTSAALVFIA
jgi:hypothetical protein